MKWPTPWSQVSQHVHVELWAQGWLRTDLIVIAINLPGKKQRKDGLKSSALSAEALGFWIPRSLAGRPSALLFGEAHVLRDDQLRCGLGEMELVMVAVCGENVSASQILIYILETAAWAGLRLLECSWLFNGHVSCSTGDSDRPLHTPARPLSRFGKGEALSASLWLTLLLNDSKGQLRTPKMCNSAHETIIILKI